VFACSTWAQTATEVAGTNAERAALASVRLVDVGSDSHCGGGNYSSLRCSGLCSIFRRGLRQPQCWRGRLLRALLFPVFACSTWAQSATVVGGRLLRALLWPLFACSTWDQTATVLAVTTAEGAALYCVSFFDVGTDSDCGGEDDF
jgi:hypothetical protein